MERHGREQPQEAAGRKDTTYDQVRIYVPAHKNIPIYIIIHVCFPLKLLHVTDIHVLVCISELYHWKTRFVTSLKLYWK